MIERMPQSGQLVWGNAIYLNPANPLSAGHFGNTDVEGEFDKGWRWFVDSNFDIVQTDWTMMIDYLKRNHKYYRS